MSKIILIHGAWHSAWCWDKVASQLRSAGYEVEVPDLPGHGEDHTPIIEVGIEAYAQRVGEILDRQSEPVIVVAHSMGGMSVTQAVDTRPEKVRTLVYLSAYFPQDGQSIGELNELASGSLINNTMELSKDYLELTLNLKTIKEVFYADCPDELIELAKKEITAEPSSVNNTQVHLNNPAYADIPKVYISCLQDKVIPPQLQKIMYEATPCKKIYTLPSSHSPFFSMPDKVTAILQEINSLELT